MLGNVIRDGKRPVDENRFFDLQVFAFNVHQRKLLKAKNKLCIHNIAKHSKTAATANGNGFMASDKMEIKTVMCRLSI